MRIINYCPSVPELKRSHSSFDLVGLDDGITPYTYVGPVGKGGVQTVDLFMPKGQASGPLLARNKAIRLDQRYQSQMFNIVYPTLFSTSISLDRLVSGNGQTNRMVSTYFSGVNVYLAVKQTQLKSVRLERLMLYLTSVAELHEKGYVHLDLESRTNALIDVEKNEARLVDFHTTGEISKLSSKLRISLAVYHLAYDGRHFSSACNALLNVARINTEAQHRLLWHAPERISISERSVARDFFKNNPEQDVYSLAADILLLNWKGFITLSKELRKSIDHARSSDPSVRPSLETLLRLVDAMKNQALNEEKAALRLRYPDMSDSAMENNFFREILSFIDPERVSLLDEITACASFDTEEVKALARLAAIGDKDLFYECLTSGDNEALCDATNCLMRLNLGDFDVARFSYRLKNQLSRKAILLLKKNHSLITGPQGEWFVANNRFVVLLCDIISALGFLDFINNTAFWSLLMERFEAGLLREDILHLTLEKLKLDLSLEDAPELFVKYLFVILRMSYFIKTDDPTLKKVSRFFLWLWRSGRIDDAVIPIFFMIESNLSELHKLESFVNANEADQFITYLTHSFSEPYLNVLTFFETKKLSHFQRLDPRCMHSLFFKKRDANDSIKVLTFLIANQAFFNLLIGMSSNASDDFCSMMLVLLGKQSQKIEDDEFIKASFKFPFQARFIKLLADVDLLSTFDEAWTCETLKSVAIGMFLYFETHKLLENFNKTFWEILFDFLKERTQLAYLHSTCITMLEEPNNRVINQMSIFEGLPKDKSKLVKKAFRFGIFYAYVDFEADFEFVTTTESFFSWLVIKDSFLQTAFEWLSSALAFGAWRGIQWNVPQGIDALSVKLSWLKAIGEVGVVEAPKFESTSNLFILMGQLNLFDTYWKLLFMTSEQAQKTYISHFCHVYRALEKGEKAFRKVKEPITDGYIAKGEISINANWKDCLTFAEQHPYSKTAYALILAARFPEYSSELITHIYAFDFLHSGYFCRSSLRPGINAFFRKPEQENINKALAKNMIKKQEMKDAEPGSRLSNICTAMRA
jgi:serine/threonine protein kinase